MGKELEIRISPDGSNVSVETFGTKGTECTALINDVMNYIGGKTSDEHKKDEYFGRDNNVFTGV